MIWPRIHSEHVIRSFLNDIFYNGYNIIFKYFISFYDFWYLLYDTVWESTSTEIKLVSFKHISTGYIRILEISHLSGFIAKNCEKTENLIKVSWILSIYSSKKLYHSRTKIEIQYMRKIAIKNLFDNWKSKCGRIITISFILLIFS